MGSDLPSSPTKSANPTQKRKNPDLLDLDTAFLHLRRYQLAMTRPGSTPSSSHHSGFGSPIPLSTPPSPTSSFYAAREKEEEANTASGNRHGSDFTDDDDDSPSFFNSNLCDRAQSGMVSMPSTSLQRLRNYSEETTALPRRSTQLTIFYNGNVHVFDNISPEKACAINVILGDTKGCDTTINFSSSSSTTTTIKKNGGKTISQDSMQDTPKQIIIPVDNVSMEEEEKKHESTLTSIKPNKKEANISFKAPISLKAQDLLHPRKISLARFISKRKEWMDHQGQDPNELSLEEAKSKPDL